MLTFGLLITEMILKILRMRGKLTGKTVSSKQKFKIFQYDRNITKNFIMMLPTSFSNSAKDVPFPLESSTHPFSVVADMLYGKPLNSLTLKYMYCVMTGRLMNKPNV